MRSERICVDMRARVCRVCTRIAISGSYQDQDQDQDKDHIPTYPHLALRVPTGPDLENSERLISGRSDLGAGNHLGTPLRQVAQGRALCDIACVQNQYNLAHRDDDALIDALAADGIAYVPFFPLGGFTPLQSTTLSEVAQRLGHTPMQVALAWLLQRAPNTFLRWSVKKQLSAPKLCSFKAAALPYEKSQDSTERNAQIQAVVKLHTLQSLQHAQKVSKREGKTNKSAGKVVTIEEDVGAEEEKESVEYVVVQRTLRKGKMGPWQIWGFADEMTLSQLKK